MANEQQTSIKAFEAGGLAAIVEYIKQAQSTGDDVGRNLATLATTVNEVLTGIGEAISTLDSTKAYIAVSKDFTLTASAWVEDTSGSEVYPWKYELALTGVTVDVRADVVFDHASAYAAGNCGVSSVSSTAENKVILRSSAKPTVNLTGTLYLTRGKASASNEEE